MSPAFVFVVLAVGISEHSIVTEVRGVFAHMHQTTSLVRQIQADGQKALVTKHHVEGLGAPAMQLSWLPGGSQPAFPRLEEGTR